MTMGAAGLRDVGYRVPSVVLVRVFVDYFFSIIFTKLQFYDFIDK